MFGQERVSVKVEFVRLESATDASNGRDPCRSIRKSAHARFMTKLLVGRVSASRSKTMSAIRGKHTKAELRLRQELSKLGLRYRLHKRGLPGSPDVVFVKQKVAV